MSNRIVILKASIPPDDKVKWIKSLRSLLGTEHVSLKVAKEAIDDIMDTGRAKFLLVDTEDNDIGMQILTLKQEGGFTVESDPDSDPTAALRKAAIAYLIMEEDEKAFQTLQVLLDRTYGVAMA